MEDKDFLDLINDFSKLEQVDAIALAGSRTTKMNDSFSDYDVYIYVNKEIPVDIRQEITSRYCSEMELNNQFWETEDDGCLNSGTEIELLYRNLDWLDKELERVVLKSQANVGYSTCFWSNLSSSKILFDSDGRFAELQNKYSVEYSKELATAIIAKNLPLLCDVAPAYPKQVAKAIKRQDYLSVQHRLTEYLASYFDVLFAVNFIPHPGEKRLLQMALKLCSNLPDDFEQTMDELLVLAGNKSNKLPIVMTQASEKLRQLIERCGL